MKQVPKEQFFARIISERLDVHPEIVSSHMPYTSEWRFHRQHGKPLYGKSIDRVEGGRIATDYFLAS